MGEAGVGKTVGTGTLARMKGMEPIVIDCGGKNLEFLLYQYVPDDSGRASFFKQLQERLDNLSINRNPSLSDQSFDMLKKVLGENLVAKRAADVQTNADRARRRFEGIKFFIKWSQVDLSPGSEVRRTIEAISKDEHMDAASGGLNLKLVEGPVVSAWREGREIILDEYNKGKPGTDGAMQILWQVLNGEMPRHTIRQGEFEFTFDRADMKPGFFCTLTGNMQSDGSSTFAMSKSMLDRISKNTLSRATVDDYAHRISQLWTGLPITTLVEATKGSVPFMADKYLKWFMRLRMLGANDGDVPRHHVSMLENHANVAQAARQLAKFYHPWCNVLDANSSLSQKLDSNLTADIADLDEYSNSVGVGMRMIIRHVNRAYRPLYEVGPAAAKFDLVRDWELESKENVKGPESPLARYGTKISRIIMSEINSTTHFGSDEEQKELRKFLVQTAETCGISGGAFEEGKAVEGHLIADLLNVSGAKGAGRFSGVRKSIIDSIRLKYPNETAKINDEAIAPADRVTKLLSDMYSARHSFPLVNLDLAGVNMTPVYKAVGVEKQGISVPGIPVGQAASRVQADEMFVSLCNSEIRRMIFEYLAASPDIAQNRSDKLLRLAALAICTFELSEGRKDAIAHVLWSSVTDKALVFSSSEIPENLGLHVKQTGCYFINTGYMFAPGNAKEQNEKMLVDSSATECAPVIARSLLARNSISAKVVKSIGDSVLLSELLTTFDVGGEKVNTLVPTAPVVIIKRKDAGR
jgi:hypothetical protein